MAESQRFLPAGQDGLLIELADLETTLTLHDRLRASPLEGVTEMVVGARTLLLSFDGRVTDPRPLVARIRQIDLLKRTVREGETIEIPVTYDGEDLDDVARLLGWSVPELIRRHGAATYTVAFTGFAPGFAYMTSDDPALEVSRRTSPRTRIPAGSVALGGKFGGIYPSDSPGGWQLIGRTPLKMWDINRSPPALLAPGHRVRFREIGKEAPAQQPTTTQPAQASVQAGPSARGLLVTRADRPALFQDLGRPAQAPQGVSVSGALDRYSLSEANLCVGNPPGAAAVEIAYGGFAVRAGLPVTLAVAGAPAPLKILTAEGRSLPAPHGRPFALDAGDELTLAVPPEGTRSYLALRGGFAVKTTLGSAATDTLARVGPPPIHEGDLLLAENGPCAAVDPFRPPPPSLPKPSDTVVIDVAPGPREDWLTPDALRLLLDQPWEVTSETSRVGARLRGAQHLTRQEMKELPSEGTPRGAIQVPHSGEPVLFLADHPVTGGYPVIAVVARHHLDLAGQVPIGARIRFRALPCFGHFRKDSPS
jgi:KipI family sensor histidine kinase inhibitor